MNKHVDPRVLSHADFFDLYGVAEGSTPELDMTVPHAKLRVLVCGGRDFSDRDLMFRTLYGLMGTISDATPLGTIEITIIHGGARGADRLADEFAVVNWAPFMEFKADWSRYGHAAGPIRNEAMLEGGKPDLVVAFAGGAGTRDMVSRARRAGVEVRLIGWAG